MDGIELLDQIGDRWSRIRSIILAESTDAAEVERAIHHGILGLVVTTESIETLLDVMESVRNGRRSYRCGLSQDVISNYRQRKPSTRQLETAITPRQIQVLGLICQGKTEREIGEQLGISHNTVHVHKNNIMQSLQVHSKVGLVKYAAKHNLISI
jgi:DNA-binding NarL/FixJ family response regulator